MQKEINSILGERVKDLRIKNGYTRENLAEKISVSTRFLADLESGKVGVSISTLKNIAVVLDTTADYLIGISELNKSDLTKVALVKKLESFSNEQLIELSLIIDSIKKMSADKN